MRLGRKWGALAAAWLAFGLADAGAQEQAAGARADRTIARALGYLGDEVASWRPKNGCYSCHNNGDAARAMMLAGRLGYPIRTGALGETLDWLRAPAQWDHNRGEGPYSDKKLARIQFAAALTEAGAAGLIQSAEAASEAGRLLVEIQTPEGAWGLDTGGALGSPVTYGPYLATALAIRTLSNAEGERYASAIEEGARWLSRSEPKTVLDAAACLIGLRGVEEEKARDTRRRALELLGGAQKADGGWGPYRISASEPFDTAIALIALAEIVESGGEAQDSAKFGPRIESGRGYLAQSQLRDGSWPETTRPEGYESYAQRLSTAGWATMALVMTSRRESKP